MGRSSHSTREALGQKGKYKTSQAGCPKTGECKYSWAWEALERSITGCPGDWPYRKEALEGQESWNSLDRARAAGGRVPEWGRQHLQKES